MKGELLKRLFRAIASEDTEAIQSMLSITIEEERKSGHINLAEQLENIARRNSGSQPGGFLPDYARQDSGCNHAEVPSACVAPSSATRQPPDPGSVNTRILTDRKLQIFRKKKKRK